MNQNRKEIDSPKGDAPSVAPVDVADLPVLVDVSRLVEMEVNVEEILNYVSVVALLSPRAYEVLLLAAYKSTEQLRKIAEKKPEYVKQIAARQVNWPVLVSPSKRRIKAIEAYIKEIGLGKNTLLQVSAKNLLRTDTPARRWLIAALKTINEVRHTARAFAAVCLRDKGSVLENFLDYAVDTGAPVDWSELAYANNRAFLKACYALPNLTKNTADQWFPVIKMYVMHHTANEPEKNAELRRIGIYRKKEDATNNPRSVENRIRHAIFDKIKAALKNMADQ